MGESTCLLRSFSTPADNSTVPQQGNPMRVLGESISFGRFMSETLDWEKWSTFTQNCYVEEAEKYSKPGSVAAKKAYFEAHYKKKAAEKAATLVEEANTQANGTFDSETQEANCTDSSVMGKSKVDDVVPANEQPDKDAVDCQVVDYADTKQYKCGARQSDLGISNVEGEVGQSGLDISYVEGARDLPLPCIDNSNRFDHVQIDKNIVVPGEERKPDLDTADQEVLPLPAKVAEVKSPKLSTKTRAAKLSNSLNRKKAAAALPPKSGINKKSVRVSTEDRRLTAQSLHMSIDLATSTGETSKAAAQCGNGIRSVSKSKKSIEGSVEKKRLTTPSLCMSVNLPSGAGKTIKTAAVAAAAAVTPRNSINQTSKSIKSVGNLAEKRPTARSLCMSISLPSGAGVTSKMTSVFERNRIGNNHSNLPTTFKDHPTSSRISTKVKASSDLLNQASKNPLSHSRRTDWLLSKSMFGSVTAIAKLSSISADCMKSSSTTKSNPRLPTISSPFRFRSEERAVKRKEFLQRMDGIKNKEAEKVLLQRTPKEAVEHDHKKLRPSSGSKPKLNEERHSGSTSQSNQIRKTSLTLPQSPKSGKKASSSTLQDKNWGTLWKPPMSTNGSKHIVKKLDQTTRQSVSSLPKATQENASPNIQH